MHGLGIKLAVVAAGVLAASQASAQCAAAVEWPVAGGGNGHTYQACDQVGTWAEASAAAHAQDGCYLATITSAAENAFVNGIANQDAWVGGYQPDSASEPAGGWSWVTGESFDFTNWNGGEPNNDGNQDCLVFYQTGGPPGTWDDGTCGNTQNQYIVECGAVGVAAIPTLSSWGLMALIAALWLGAMIALRRARRRNSMTV